jgi:drug/metabolite transporter (DMT)-like permease
MGIIMVPLIMILKKEYPSRNNMVGILIILIGILTSNWGNTDGAGLLGGLYILGSAASMSVYTVLATEYTKETDPSLLPACNAVAAQHLCHCHGHVHDLIRLY